MRRTIRNKTLGALPLLLLAGAASGCDTETVEPWNPTHTWTSETALRPLASCDDALGAARRQLTVEMETQLATNLQHALEARSATCWDDRLDAAEGDAAPVPGTAADSASGGAQDYSTTNTQVVGVDEADIVKNDGSHIYLLAGSELLILEAWPADKTRVLASVALDGRGLGMFVEGDRMVVYAASGGYGGCYGYRSMMPPPPPDGSGARLDVLVFDIADRAAPRLERTLTLGGSYVGSRRVGEAVHTVVQLAGPGLTLPTWPEDLSYWRLCDGNTSARDIRAAFTRLLGENRQRIAAVQLTDVLPVARGVDYHADGTSSATPQLFGDCRGLYDAPNPTSRGILTVLSFPMQDDTALSLAAIFGGAGTVYASAESLYVAQTEYLPYEEGRWYADERTVIHKFALDNDAARADYRASGSVAGRLVNQFAMDEREGFLRLATTEGHLPDPDTTNSVLVLAEDTSTPPPCDGDLPCTPPPQLPGGELTQVGAIVDLAPGEDIRSVRFDGDRGFLVTFKKTDPLFTFDLSDPYAPQLSGELKIPGFSTYMHFMDPDHLLTIGFDADDQGDFAYFTGVMLQIFDVSDMTQPTLTHKHIIGTRGTTSDATSDHLAFNYFGSRQLLALPMGICEDYQGNGQYGQRMTFNGLLVFGVSPETGFVERARIDHRQDASDDYVGWPESGCYNWWQSPSSQVKRSVFMEDYVYSISSEQLLVNRLGEEAEPPTLVDVPLPQSSWEGSTLDCVDG